MGAANKAFGSLKAAAKSSEKGFQQDMAAAVMLGNVLSNVLLGGLNAAVSGFKSLTIESVNVAARFEQIRQAAYLTGMRMGQTQQQVDEMIDSIRSYGIEADVAADLVVQFSRYQLDLTKATELARVAQDAGVITGRNSSETLKSLTWAIQTNSTEMLRSAGVSVDLAQAQKRMAEELGKNVSNLTEAERQQAALNAVIEEGAKIAGAYELSTNTAAGALKSMQRVMNDMRVALGEPFLEGYREFILGTKEATQALTEMMKPGGQLYPVLVKLGAIFLVIGRAFRDFATNNLNDIADWAAGSLNSFSEFAGVAAGYGANIIAQFARGMADAITTILVPIIQWLAALLTSWFAPGSPPRVAPQIDEWGYNTAQQFLKGMTWVGESDMAPVAEAIQNAMQPVLDAVADLGGSTMMALLHGMTQADFDVLSSMQGTFEAAFRAMGLEDSEGLFKELSSGAMAALASGADTDFLNQVTASLGEYGQEISELVDIQLDLAAANEAVQAAETAPRNSRKQEESSQENLNKVINEYNKMAKEGASPAALAAKRAEFEASRAQRDAARQAREEAEDSLETASEGNEELRERVSLQQALVDQLLRLTQAAAQESAGGGGGGGGGMPEMPAIGGGGGMPEIDPSKISEDVKKMADDIQKKLEDAFKPLTDLGNSPEMKELKEAFKSIGDTLSGIDTAEVTKFFDTLIENETAVKVGEVAAKILLLAGGFKLAGTIIGGIITVFSKLRVIFEVAAIVLGTTTLVVGGLVAGIAALVYLIVGNPGDWQGAWVGIWNNFVIIVEETIERLKLAWSAIGPLLGVLFVEIKELIRQKAQEAWQKLVDAVQEAKEKVSGFVEQLKAVLYLKFMEIMTSVILLRAKFEDLRDKVSNVVDRIKDFVRGLKTSIEENINTAKGILDGLKGAWNDAYNAVMNSDIGGKIRAAFSGIAGFIQGVIEKLKRVVELIREIGGVNGQGTTATNKAIGGDVRANRAYVVGERGRELFVPGTDGNIIPNNIIRDMAATLTASVAAMTRAARIAQVAKTVIIPALSGNTTNQNNYNLTMKTSMSAQTVQQGFAMLKALG
jgi:hypothetical protein